MISIEHLDEIKTADNSYFVLVYKSGSNQSECAYRSIASAAAKSEKEVYTADVNQTRADFALSGQGSLRSHKTGLRPALMLTRLWRKGFKTASNG